MLRHSFFVFSIFSLQDYSSWSLLMLDVASVLQIWTWRLSQVIALPYSFGWNMCMHMQYCTLGSLSLCVIDEVTFCIWKCCALLAGRLISQLPIFGVEISCWEFVEKKFVLIGCIQKKGSGVSLRCLIRTK